MPSSGKADLGVEGVREAAGTPMSDLSEPQTVVVPEVDKMDKEISLSTSETAAKRATGTTEKTVSSPVQFAARLATIGSPSNSLNWACVLGPMMRALWAQIYAK